ncbi:MAG: hypothetical protein ACPGVZ_06085 [Myxococcota bacterium]
MIRGTRRFRLSAVFSWMSLLFSLMACTPSSLRLSLDGPTPGTRVANGLYHAADPTAAPVTLENLVASERFWPHQVQLVEDWKPDGFVGDFGWGMGVVIEVDAASRVRVDFSRFGKHWIPASVTDIIARANAIRLGESVKFKPNLVLALGNRLLDPTGRTLAEAKVDLLDQNAFVLVFADPLAPDFPALVTELAPAFERTGIHFVLLAQGGHPDFHVWKGCHDAGWPGSFLLDRFAPAYSEGFLDAETPMPWVEIRSPEGRRLWQGGAARVSQLPDLVGS